MFSFDINNHSPRNTLNYMILLENSNFINKMQNSVSNYINNKIININSELLFREAEDDFFYFNNLKRASEKLKKAIELTPCHIKSIILYADICFVKGNFKKALSLYVIANGQKPCDCRILASIANCYSSLRNFEEAIYYCDLALNCIESIDNAICSQLLELKITILTELKRYDEACTTFIYYKNRLKSSLAISICSALNEKIKLQKKLQDSGLKVI